MKYDLVIATTLYFKPYGHVKDGEYRRKLWENMQLSLAKSDMSSMDILHVTRESEPEDWNNNYLELLDFCKDQAPLCLIADSDGYFAPDWLHWLVDIMRCFPDVSGWQLYRSPRLADYDVEGMSGMVRRHASPHGLCFRTAKYIRPRPGEWFETFIGNLGCEFIVPRISRLQHCGQYGLNNVPGGSEDFDPNFPLNHECGLAQVSVA